MPDKALYAVKCFLQNQFEPPYPDGYSSFDVVTVLVELLSEIETDLVHPKEELVAYLAPYLEMSYENADNRLLKSTLFTIGSIQECYTNEVAVQQPVVEIFRDFYSFESQVTTEEFLQKYYFDDLGVME
ncbi:hypothetical protein ACVR1I_07195 [Streptococcus cameli]